MYRDHCYNSSPSYQESIQSFSSHPNRIVQQDRIVQFPFHSSNTANEEKSEEDLLRQVERRKEATKRLQEQAVKQRTEKIERQQEEMKVFGELRSEQSTMSKINYDVRSLSSTHLPSGAD